MDSAVPGPTGAASLTRQAKYAPGAQVRVRDEQWLVKTVTPVGDEDWMVEATGVSSFVRGTDAAFYDKLDYIEALDPKKTLLVPDDSPDPPQGPPLPGGGHPQDRAPAEEDRARSRAG
ncbi:hypothetical protein SMICM17S_00344 [Streptomyces microflavus]